MALLVQAVLSRPSGIVPHPEDALHGKRTAERLFRSDYLRRCPRTASREIGAEAEVVLTVMPTSTAARLGLEPGEVYPEVLATRNKIGETVRASQIALPRRRTTL